MPSSRIALGITGGHGAVAVLDGIASRGRSARPAMNAIADLFLAVEKRQFDTKGAYAKTPWAALADSTRATKARKRQHAAILDATGYLLRSLTVKGASGQTLDPSAHSVSLTTDAFYAHFHQFGKGSKRRIIAQVGEGDRRAIVELLTGYMTTGTLSPIRPAGG